MITNHETVQLFGISAVSSVLGGFVGAVYFPGVEVGEKKTVKDRWAANLCTGIIGGPLATLFIAAKFPDVEVPIPVIAAACSGLIGMLGVLLLTIVVPILLKWITSLVSSKANVKKDE